jgi:16S rRNA processing protein RimM
MVPMAASDTGPAAGLVPDGWIEIGRAGRPHGLSGGLEVQLHSDDPSNLLAATEVLLLGDLGTVPFRIARGEPAGKSRGGGMWVHLWLVGLDSRERAEKWRGARLFLRESELRALPEGEFYWRDVIGLRVRLPDGTSIGVVEEIWPTGSNDVLVVRDAGTERLIPALRSVLARFDLQARELWIEPMPGLLDEPEEDR